MAHLWKVGIPFGIVLLALGPVCVVHVWRASRAYPNLRWPIRLVLLLLACALFIFMPSVMYRVDGNTRVLGVPFFAGIWAREGDHWTDFVGPFTAIASLGNAIVGAFLPFILASVLFRLRHAQPN